MRNADVRRHNRHTFTVGCECHQGMRGGAFQYDGWSDIRIMTSGVEPAARGESAVQEQQRFIRKLTNVDRATAPKRMRWRDHGQDVRRIEHAAEEQLVAC